MAGQERQDQLMVGELNGSWTGAGARACCPKIAVNSLVGSPVGSLVGIPVGIAVGIPLVSATETSTTETSTADIP